MSAIIAYVENTNTILLTGLKDELDEVFINDANVTVTVKDSTGAEVAGQVWPATMDYLSGSDGDYALGLTHTLSFAADQSYTAFIDADGSVSGGVERFGHWEMKFKARKRIVS